MPEPAPVIIATLSFSLMRRFPSFRRIVSWGKALALLGYMGGLRPTSKRDNVDCQPEDSNSRSGIDVRAAARAPHSPAIAPSTLPGPCGHAFHRRVETAVREPSQN